MCDDAITEDAVLVGSKVWRLDASATPPDEAGGKVFGLHLIARVGLPLPRSWIVLPGADEADLRAITTQFGKDERVSLAVRSSARDEDRFRCSFAGIHETLLGVSANRLSEAREFGLPCVANIDGVTRHLEDGDVVRVDGSQGTVTVLFRSGGMMSRTPSAVSMESQGSGDLP